MNLHKLFILSTFLLTGFGLIMVASSSGFQAQISFGNPLHFLIRQVTLGIGVGFFGFLAGYLLSPSLLRKLVLPFLFLAILLLVAVLIPGIGVAYGGSRRWIEFFGFSFQPSEIAKLALILYSSSWLASHKNDLPNFWKGFLPFLVVSIPIPLLILLEPNISNFGISVLLILILLFVAGARFWHLTGLTLVAIFIFAVALFLVPARLERVLTFINPQEDTRGASYQINQSLIAIGSGGLTGKGLGDSSQKLGFLPEPSGDAIFAIIAEEFGFVGSTALVLFYLLFLIIGIIIAKRTSDLFSQYVTIGFVSLVTLQAFINICAVSGLFPLTGITLPFVSYGSTALAVFLTGSGILSRIAKRAS